VKIMDSSVGDSVIHCAPEFEKRWNRWVRRVKASCRRSAAELVIEAVLGPGIGLENNRQSL
jgi:hypothetical protein